MRIEHLRARYDDDGTEVPIIKSTEAIDGHPHIDGTPSFDLKSGEHLNPLGDSLKRFKAFLSGRTVTLID